MDDVTIIDRIAKGVKDIEDKIDKLDEKFAGKWVERDMKWGTRFIIGLVLAAVVGTVLASNL